MHYLSFSQKHVYTADDSGIGLPVVLSCGGSQVELLAKVDTGAAFCIFQRDYGEALNLDVEGGTQQSVRTAIGPFVTFGHSVSLEVLGSQFDVIVYFAQDREIKRNVLGRRGWIRSVRLGVIDYDSEIYVSDYNG